MNKNEVDGVICRYRKSENEGGMRQCEEISRNRRFCQLLVGSRAGGRLSGSAPPSHLQVAVGVGERGLGVVHGQHQTRAPHHQLVIAVGQLSVQVVRGRAAAGVGAAGIGADGNVAVGQIDMAVRQDEVGVVIFQLALVLARRQRNNKQEVKYAFKTLGNVAIPSTCGQ